MSNHFHLLVECELENLSLFMKHINSNYAIYVNKKYKRSGHVWQGRFYSRFVNSDEYFYTLVKYIEHNPVQAGMANLVGEYRYTLLWMIKNKTTPIECALHSKLIDEIKDIDEFIQISLGEEELQTLQLIEKQKILHKDDRKSLAYTKPLKDHFKNIKKPISRDKAIQKALDDGYTQAQIGRYLELSRARISQLVKGFDIDI